jgi:hypothetical protein
MKALQNLQLRHKLLRGIGAFANCAIWSDGQFFLRLPSGQVSFGRGNLGGLIQNMECFEGSLKMSEFVKWNAEI